MPRPSPTHNSADLSIGAAPTPSGYARLLLDSLGLGDVSPELNDCRDPNLLWALSGAMWLSGHAEGAPRPCPAPLATCAQGAWLALSALCPERIDPSVNAFQWLGERAAISGLTRRGTASAGGSCRILQTSDGMLALNIARDDDRELFPAWLEHCVESDGELTAVLARRLTSTLVERARVLGLAVAPVGAPRPSSRWYRATRLSPIRKVPASPPLVIDLSALWAGPLCGQLLSRCGARVIKVESSRRPDGARFGPARFFDLMNAGKESVALDLSETRGRERLRALILHADIVIESSRPRALEQMGICAADIVAEKPGRVWLSITGYGRRAPMRDWIAYGDDAGVAAGLSWLMGGDRGDPVICGDAIADPLTGLHAALLALAAWRNGGGQLLDISLHDVVAHCINVGSATAPGAQSADCASMPVAREVRARAAELGVDTERVLGELG